MNTSQTLKILLTAGCFACLVDSVVAYDPAWSRSDCATYSYHGLHERYVRGGRNGWIDNDVWDSPDVEGLDCSSYVSRCLALPNYVPEGDTAPYPYDPDEFFYGLVDHMVRIDSIEDLQPWDVWVWLAAYGGPSNQHTGLFVRFDGSYIISREALNEENGIVERSWRKQDMIDWGCRFYRRENWATPSTISAPTVETYAAGSIQDSAATLNGLITDDGGGTIDSRGFEWGRTSACDGGWIDGSPSSNGAFSARLSGLAADTRYYFRAMAHNSAGWGSGQVRSFTTDTAPSGPQIIIDNGQSGTSYTGTWGVSGGANPYGTNSLWARDGATYTWRFSSQPAGVYQVFMWWTEYPSRGTAIPVAINHAAGTAQTTVNQQTSGGQWNSLGQYDFNGQGTVTLTANGSYPISHCADAVKFVWVEAGNQPPVAVIDSITPQSAQTGQQVTMVGHGTDDGSITAYQWSSSRDGLLGAAATFITASLSEGTHTISFRVCDDQNVWSQSDQETITISPPEPNVEEVIIDNGDSGTASSGTWDISGGPNPYGSNSLWARSGATYTWNASLTPGLYEVFLWWTEYASRSSSVPVQIQHAGGTTEISVNQQTDGGQWNSLGQFNFNNTGAVTLFAPSAYPTSYCADAVRFLKLTSTSLMAEFTAAPTSGTAPLTVKFTDLSSAPGSIDAWRWDFDNDGTLDSTQQNPSYTFTAPGIYSVRLVVYADGASDELVVTDYINVSATGVYEEIVLDNGDEGTSSWGTWGVSGGADPYGANSLWARETAGYRWAFTPQQDGQYEVFLWWTEYYSRGTRIPVTVTHRYGTADMTVNQQTGGGQWNLLGTYRMDAGQSYYVQVNTAGDGSTACADAVRVQQISD